MGDHRFFFDASMWAPALAFAFIGILACFFWVIVPVAVLEGRFLSSFRRSYILTKGHRWRIFGLVILLIAFARLIYWASGVIAAQATILDQSYTPAIMISWAATSFVTAFSAVVITVSYYRLRLLKDGVPEGGIKAAFD